MSNLVQTPAHAPFVSVIPASNVIDWSIFGNVGGVYTQTLSANTVFTFSNKIPGQTILVRLTNTASNWTVSFTGVTWSAGTAPTQTTGAKSDLYTLMFDGTTVFGNFVQNY